MDNLNLRPITRNEWGDFVSHYPEALLFHTSVWLDLLTQVYGMEWHPLGIWTDHTLVGVFPLQTRKLGPFRLVGSPLMQVIASTPFMGPLVRPVFISSSLVGLEQVLREWKADHIEIAFPRLLDNTEVPGQLGYSEETCAAVIMPLAGRTCDQLWSGMSGKCRRAVRKAEASGVRVVEAEDNSFLDEYYRMCEQVYQGSGRRPHLSKEFYRTTWDALAGQQRIKVLLAEHEGNIVGGAIFLLGRRTIYYLSGASHHDALPLKPNTLIQWRLLTWAVEHHYALYDMGGDAVPSITQFKLSFGGRRSFYTRLYRATNARARMARLLYKKTIPLWRKVDSLWGPRV